MPTIKFSAFFISLVDHLGTLAAEADTLAHEYGLDVTNLGWMWDFFAEPDKAGGKKLVDRLRQFWKGVQTDAVGVLRQHKEKKYHEQFFKTFYPEQMTKEYKKLESAFKRWVSGKSFTLIFLFDEARALCEVSAYDGQPLIDDTSFTAKGSRIEGKEETGFSFSNFCALRRALRLSLEARQEV